MTTPLLPPRPLQIQGEQAGERVLGRNVLGPTVGGGDGAVERVVGVGEPTRALIVEIGQGALLELDRRLDGLGQNTVGIAPRRLAGSGGRRNFRHDVDETGRIEPGAAQVVEPLGGFGDANGARVAGVVGGGNVRGQAPPGRGRSGRPILRCR